MRKKLITILLLFVAIICTNCNKTQEEPKNDVQIVVLESDNLKCNDTMRIYHPQSSDTIGTLVLLHGWSGCYKDWGDKMDIQEIANKYQFRIITPDGFYNSWYIDNTDDNQMQTRKFFNEEFIPYIYKEFNLEPATTFISGLSMGGHGAVNIFIDNHSKFRAAGSMSGVLNLEKTTLQGELEKIMGDKLKERAKSESATTRLSIIANTNKPIIVSCGYSDYYFMCTEEFINSCKENNVPYIRIDSPGTHSWRFWEYALNSHLWYFSRMIKGEELGY